MLQLRSVVAALAVGAATLSVAGPAAAQAGAPAHRTMPATVRAVAAADPGQPTNAERCVASQTAVSRAQARLDEARTARKDRKAKVAKARARLVAAKHRSAVRCDLAARTVATSQQVAQLYRSYVVIMRGDAVDAVPPTVSTDVLELLARLGALLDASYAQLPTATPAQLAEVQARVAALHPDDLAGALDALVTAEAAAGNDPETVSAILEAVRAGFTDLDRVPASPLATLRDAIRPLGTALDDAVPTTVVPGADLAAQMDAVVAGLHGTADAVTTAAPATAAVSEKLAVLCDLSARHNAAAWGRMLGSLLNWSYDRVTPLTSSMPFHVGTLLDAPKVSRLMTATATFTGAQMPDGYQLTWLLLLTR